MERTLVEDIFDWMKTYKTNSVKPGTYDRLETSFELMKKYDISDKVTSELTEDDLQAYVNELAKDGYALSTIKKQFHLISGYLRYAHRKGTFARPIYNGVKLPRPSALGKETKDILVYSIPEQEKLRKVFETGEMPGYFAALLMMESGMRVGECLALTWGDIDWTRRAIHICKTFVRLGNRRRQFVQNEAKSFTSNRTIPISQKAYRYLQRMASGEHTADEYIFKMSDGRPMSYEAMRYQVGRACKKAGVRYLGQHVFRHTFATNCYNRGCDVKILSKLLGHANVNITYNVYIHLFGDALEEMRSVVG